MRTITIQNIPIKIKDEECICNQNLVIDRTRTIENQRVDITFIVGEKCNAKCEFCCGPTELIQNIDIDAFKTFFTECISKINVRKITFTGGEPTLLVYFNKIKEICLWIKSVSPYTEIIINTNGTNLVILDNQEWIDTIALSRHHYNSNINDAILKTHSATDNEIISFKDKNKITLSCVCQKRYIDSGEELEKYLNYALSLGINMVGIYSLIPINKFAIDNYIDPYNFIFSKNVLNYKIYDYPRKNVCQCKNFTYINNDLKSIFFYIRKNLNPSYNKGSYIVWKNNKINSY